MSSFFYIKISGHAPSYLVDKYKIYYSFQWVAWNSDHDDFANKFKWLEKINQSKGHYQISRAGFIT